jgi:serine/threonine protein kinase
LLTKVKSQLIINMRQAFQDRENLYLVMDFMPGGDLRYHICRHHKFVEQ